MTRRSSTIRTTIPHLSKTTNENTSQFGVHTVFESFVLHVSHDDFALHVDNKEGMHAIGKPSLDRETEEREGFAISDAESMSKKGQRNSIWESFSSDSQRIRF